ncbi:MAG: electron transport complex subunit E [Deltaproteobacteria bacterium]|nr:electron transport complex subunit E [Candidatus Zymogenaceae bacterium]
MATWSDFTRGLWREHPIFVLVLGMCPTLAVTTSAINGIGMGLATTFVLVCSNIVVSSVRNIIPSKVRIPSFIVVIASFVTIVDLVMNGYFHDLHKTLGLFIPLIVVNCLILGRSEAFASKKPIFDSLIDGLGMGIGFTLGLFILGAIREVLGNGSILGLSIFGTGFHPLLVMVLPPGAFITLGFLLGLMNVVEEKRRQQP